MSVKAVCVLRPDANAVEGTVVFEQDVCLLLMFSIFLHRQALVGGVINLFTMSVYIKTPDSSKVMPCMT